jgi:hypothetical protein
LKCFAHKFFKLEPLYIYNCHCERFSAKQSFESHEIASAKSASQEQFPVAPSKQIASLAMTMGCSARENGPWAMYHSQ